jgi:hypothetical protein
MVGSNVGDSLSFLPTEAVGIAAAIWPYDRKTRDDLAGLVRPINAIGGAWLASRLTDSLTWLIMVLTVAFSVYGVMLTTAIGYGVWFKAAKGPAA